MAYRAALILIFCQVSMQSLTAQASTSVFDLRQSDFNEPVELKGTWDFFWMKLVSPGDTSSKAIPMNVPSDWYDGTNKTN
ncbi:MAG TPA: hypothetical protein VIN11_01270, partial [Roseivirga sp.]